MVNMNSIGIIFLTLLLILPTGCDLVLNIKATPPVGTVGSSVLFEVLNPPFGALDLVSWSFNSVLMIQLSQGNTMINPVYSRRIQYDNASGSLELQNLTLSDQGLYTIIILYSEFVEYLGTLNFSVYEPVSNVTVSPNATNLVEFNDTVSLTCSASGSSLSFHWLNGSSDITLSERVHLSADNQILTISSVLRSDWGPMYCNVTNVINSDISYPCTLNISFGPDNVAVSVKPQPPIYSPGSNLTLSCSAQSSPAAEFHWAFNEAMLNRAGQDLKLENVEKSQTGNYTCWAHNTRTLRSKSSEPLLVTILEKILGGAITGPTEPLIAGKSSVNLSCQAASGTIITRVWLKDGQPLSPSNRIIFSTDNSTVTISHVEKGDAGQYQCKIINPVSTDTAEYSLIVNYGPESVTVMGKNSAEINEEVEFKCSALSVPSVSNFNWIFNGTRTDVKTAQYIIKQASYSDSGNYTCEASNEVTGLRASSAVHHLVVQENLLSHGLSGGAIAGIVISVLVVLGLIAAGLVFAVKKKRPSSSNPNATNARSKKADGGEMDLTYENIDFKESSQVQKRNQPPAFVPETQHAKDLTYENIDFKESSQVQKRSQPPEFVPETQHAKASTYENIILKDLNSDQIQKGSQPPAAM